MKEKIYQPVVEELKNINNTLIEDQKIRKEQDEKKDRMWIIFGEFRDDFTIFKKKVDDHEDIINKHETTLFCTTPTQEGLVFFVNKQINLITAMLNRLENTIHVSDSKQDERLNKFKEELKTDMTEIKNRNLKKDAIGNFKSEIPNKWLTYLQIATLIAPIIFYILSLNK